MSLNDYLIDSLGFITDNIRLFTIAGTAIVVGMVGSALIYSVDSLEKRKKEFSQLVEKVKYKAAGEDRIWTTAEKRIFLDHFGITKPIGEGQDIYLIEHPNMSTESQNVEVFAGTARRVIGDIIQSGEALGNIRRDKMESYIGIR